MNILIGIIIAIVALVLLVAYSGYKSLKRSVRQANEEADKVDIDRIPSLAEECIRVFREKFGVELDHDRFEETAMAFSERIDDFESIKKGFAKDDFYWYGILPCGAFLGEFLRKASGGRWSRDDDGVPILEIPVGDEPAVTYPFHKILKQATSGDKRDIYAYIESSRHLGELAEQIDDGNAEKPPGDERTQ